MLGKLRLKQKNGFLIKRRVLDLPPQKSTKGEQIKLLDSKLVLHRTPTPIPQVKA